MQKLQLSIPEPCHENWHMMTPTQQGRFCNACAKEVVDFSMMTDSEVLNYFTTITHGKVCGRALPSQLDRTITRPKEPKKRLFWYWNYIVMFFMFFSKTNTVKAQGGVKRVTEISNTPACKVGDTVRSSSRVISGKVADVDGNPVSFATIRIKNNKVAFWADVDGLFKMNSMGKEILEVSAVSYDSKEISVLNKTHLNITLESSKQMSLGEFVIVKRKCTNRTFKTEKKNVVKDSIKVVKTLLSGPANIINIYPNPLKRGSSFTFSIKLKHTGNYHIDIIDASGRIQMQKQINTLSKEYIEQVQTDNRWSSGLYYIRVFDNNNKPINKASFIVQ